MDGNVTSEKPTGFDEAVALFNIEAPVVSITATYEAISPMLSTEDTGPHYYRIDVNANSDAEALTYKYFYKKTSETDYIEYTRCSNSEATCYIANLPAYYSFDMKVIVSDNYGNSTEATALAGPYCFVAGTKVLTDNGFVNIEDIKVGDMVYTLNLDTNERELNKVTETFINQTIEIYELTINNKIIKATPKHQFYVVDKGWIRAYDLTVGDKLDTKDIDTVITDIKYTELDEPINVYNITVENSHNYLITESEVLVHNASSGN